MFPGTFARITPDKPAAVMAGSGESLTYRQLADNSARLARYLHGLGLRRGVTRWPCSPTTSSRRFEIYWAAMRSGLYLTAVNHNLTPDEVAYIRSLTGRTCPDARLPFYCALTGVGHLLVSYGSTVTPTRGAGPWT